MTVKLVRAAKVAGMQVPRDISLVCFNDNFPTADLVPSLTAMALPSEEMGRTAARMLIDRLDGRDHKAKEVLLSEKLVIRESTAPPRSE
jgi:DNA-binding LacI/PurR family transcriptional regulator